MRLSFSRSALRVGLESDQSCATRSPASATCRRISSVIRSRNWFTSRLTLLAYSRLVPAFGSIALAVFMLASHEGREQVARPVIGHQLPFLACGHIVAKECEVRALFKAHRLTHFIGGDGVAVLERGKGRHAGVEVRGLCRLVVHVDLVPLERDRGVDLAPELQLKRIKARLNGASVEFLLTADVVVVVAQVGLARSVEACGRDAEELHGGCG